MVLLVPDVYAIIMWIIPGRGTWIDINNLENAGNFNID